MVGYARGMHCARIVNSARSHCNISPGQGAMPNGRTDETPFAALQIPGILAAALLILFGERDGRTQNPNQELLRAKVTRGGRRRHCMVRSPFGVRQSTRLKL